MRWVWLCLLMCVGGNVLANDYGFGWSAGSPSDPWTDSVQPSGLRFGGEASASVQTGNTDGEGEGPANGGPYMAGPGPCSACGICTHWAVRPWYAHWGPDWIGYKPHNHCHKCRPCICAPCE